MFVIQLYQYTHTALRGHAMVADQLRACVLHVLGQPPTDLYAQSIHIFLLLVGLCLSACTSITTCTRAVQSSCRSFVVFSFLSEQLGFVSCYRTRTTDR